MFKSSNDIFYNLIFPSEKRINYIPNVKYDTNNIMFTSGVIYGDIGSGKSQTFRAIAEKAVERYGIDNVNSKMESKGNIRDLILRGTVPKLVNLLFADDLTLRKISRTDLRAYFKLRHIHRELCRTNKGYILSMLGVHRFHSCPVELRTNMGFLIIKTFPSSPWDYSIIKRYVGKDHLNTLADLEKIKLENPDYKKYNIFWLKTGETGILDLELAKKDYVEVL